MNGKDVYRIYTYHGTQMLMTSDGKLIHRPVEEVSRYHFPIYARMLDDGIALFVIRNNRLEYFSTLLTDGGGGASQRIDSPTSVEHRKNVDNSISIIQEQNFLSARRDSGVFDLRQANFEWEHFYLDRAEFELTEEYFPPMMLATLDRSSEPLTPKEISPKVSVIIPMFNTEKYVEECLESLLNQTMQDYEVIVVDDCSTDRSAEIVESMSDRFDGKLTLIRLEKNNGEPGSPRNIGINCAAGKYLFFMDSDDLLKYDALEQLYNIAEEYHADVVESVTNYYLRRAQGEEFSLSQYSRRIAQTTFEPYDIAKRVSDFMGGKFEVIPWNKFVRRRCIVEHRAMFPTTYAADDAGFSFQCALSAKIYLLIPEPYYYYRIMGGTISHRRFELNDQINRHIKTINAVIKVIESFLSKMNAFDRHPIVKYMALKHFFRYCIGTVRFASEHYENNPASVIFDIVYPIIFGCVNFSDELLALIITFANSQSDRLTAKEHQIQRLQLELENLKKE